MFNRFSIPVIIFAFGLWLTDYEYLSCMLNGPSDMEYCSSL